MYKNYTRLSLAAVALACLPLAGCMDDNYDLSDIDTTAEIKVNDLVIPVNLDAITLSNVFDLEEGSVVKEIDGDYVVLVDGDFKSEQIKVNEVKLTRPYIPPTTTSISLTGNSGNITLPPVGIGQQTFTYEVSGFNTSFSYSTATVDKSIRALSRLAVDWTIDVKLTVLNTNKVFKAISFRNLTLQLPAGLHTPDFTSVNGLISLPDIDLSAGSMTHTVSIRVDEVDFAKLTPSEYTFTPDADGSAPGTLVINGNIGVGGGYVVAVTNSSASQIPQQTSLTLAPVGTDINVKSIDGTIRYAIDNFNIDPVALNDLPDLLRQEETNITISNPRLYLSINNPMAGYDLNASSGLTLTACRDNGDRKAYPLDPDQSITILHNKGIDGPYNFCLAPDPSAAGNTAGFEDASPVTYTGLGNVLGGSGLPSSIEVSFDDPHVGPGPVRNFTVPQTLDRVIGKYQFYAPLELGLNSKIVYDETTDGWSDETVDKITIERLKVNATVTNSLPFDIVISGYPIDAQGNQCKDIRTGAPVSLGSVNVKAGESSPLNLENTGTFKGVDGVRYLATAIVTKGGVTLRPDATIDITGIRATVSGFYIDEL